MRKLITYVDKDTDEHMMPLFGKDTDGSKLSRKVRHNLLFFNLFPSQYADIFAPVTVCSASKKLCDSRIYLSVRAPL